MGNLAPRMLLTATTMIVGAAGLAGLPPFAGFFSKDEILAVAFHTSRTAWALLLLGAFMTAFYTARMMLLTFFGAPRMSKEVAHHVHESPPTMTVPLVVLAALTIVAGWALGVPAEEGTRFQRLLSPVFALHEAEHGGVTAIMLLVLSVIVVLAGVLLAWFVYGAGPVRAEEIGRPRNVVHRLLLNAWYVDALYDRTIVRPLLALSEFLARLFDTRVIDGAVNGVGRAVAAWAQSLRRLQTGYVVNYALTMLAGAVAIVGFLLAR